MKILSINSCGSFLHDKKKWIKDLCVSNNIEFLAIQETKMSRLHMFRLKSFWGNQNFDFALSLARGFLGGIVSIWDPKVFKLSNSVSSHPGDYMFMDDWNSVRTDDERRGSVFCPQDASLFNDLIESNELFDVPLAGLNFTWRNKSGSMFSKIDKFFISENVLNIFKDLKSLFLPRGCSDHSPIMLFQDKVDFGPTLLKGHLKSWIHNTRSSEVKRLKEITSQIDELDIIIDAGVVSEDEVQTRNKLAFEKNDLTKFIDLDYLQKARVRWDVEGDENSKFFHSSLKRTRRIQHIQGLLVDWTWIDDPNNIKDCFFKHFQSKFDAHDSDFIFADPRPRRVLTESECSTLEADIDDDEIKKAMWCCGSSKSPGLDGVIDNIISPVQTVFIAGRQILDRPLMLSEIIDWYKSKNKKILMFKVDFEKANDSVNWEYLLSMLSILGFGNKWCSWIKGCLFSPVLQFL
ncbi:uncharacterized protein [Rutidosis leptorrhynchoides]|uniref:uncharacterized protein n=1 Tax=Rutidosis leptorrhynchoides TaxID=125765 RepID=UPI003A99F596